MTQSCWQQSITSTSEWHSDVAIVGGGICGLSLAYWLKRHRPQLSVTVLEAQQVGSGASGRNAGFNTAGSALYLAQLASKHGVEKAQSYWAFKQESLRLMREELFTQFSVDQELWGSTTLYRENAEWQQHFDLLHSMQAPGLVKVSGEQLRDQGLNGFVGGLNFSHEGRVHPIKLLTALKKWLTDQGVQFITDNAVGWGELQTGRVRLHAARQSGTAAHVFLALNGYAGQFHPSLKAWVEPKRAQMVALNIGQRKLMGNFYDPPNKVYFRQDPHAAVGTLLVGGMRLLEEAGENSDFDKTTPVIQQALQRYAEELFGETFPVLARWSGVMGFTPEEKPYIRAVPFLPQTTFVGGFSGHGMGLAFGVAHEAVARFIGLPTRFGDVLPLE